MSLAKIKLERFTAFEMLDLDLSRGINVFIGANGTGKTHLLKLAYAACDITKTKADFAEKLVRVFMPFGSVIGRLVKRQKNSTRCSIEISRKNIKLETSFTNHAAVAKSAAISGLKSWAENPVESVYIPVKEMLSNAPGFRSLYAQREIHFEEIYSDILDRAYLPALRGPAGIERKRLLTSLQQIMEGKVTIKDDEFFLQNRQGSLEFSLLAEGVRKLCLLWLLIQNGTLLNGSVLFWDEPETNLNPQLFGPLIEIILSLQRMDVQVLLATHDYVILKELDLRKKKSDAVFFHSFFRDRTSGQIQHHSTDEYLQIHPNAIQDTFLDLFDRDVKRDNESTA
ncbi:ATP-binding protein [Candidatus Magnetoovum chiemensis]|nr:ATP-binding protein [Candidatus Magnetoovum chiemensis]